MLRLLTIILAALSISSAFGDTILTGLVYLCDPAKIATISSERSANHRVRKIAYWLEMARLDGHEPANEMREVMVEVGWGGTAKGGFTADGMTLFNLGSYTCQLGDIAQAKTRVGKGIELDANFKLLALDDTDLGPLWKELAK